MTTLVDSLSLGGELLNGTAKSAPTNMENKKLANLSSFRANYEAMMWTIYVYGSIVDECRSVDGQRSTSVFFIYDTSLFKGDTKQTHLLP
jgi:hypothetical protein